MPPIPPGSRVLVTGANGFVASHVVDQLLLAGYNATGTVRSLERASWLEPFFSTRYGKGRLEVIQIPDLSESGAFDKALHDCSAVVHIASDTSLNPNVDEVIPTVVDSLKNILVASNATPTVKRFVMTSSAGAAVYTIPNKREVVDQNSWNDISVARAYSPDTPFYEKGLHVYAASKVKGEKELWDWIRQNKAGFDAVSVLPNFVTGKVLGKEYGQDGSTAGAILALASGKKDIRGFPILGFLQALPPQHFVDGVDVARLHVAALKDPDVANERIFAMSEPYNSNSILKALRKLRPDQELPADVPDPGQDVNEITGKQRANALLEKYYGKKFRTLEESLEDALVDS